MNAVRRGFSAKLMCDAPGRNIEAQSFAASQEGVQKHRRRNAIGFIDELLNVVGRLCSSV